MTVKGIIAINCLVVALFVGVFAQITTPTTRTLVIQYVFITLGIIIFIIDVIQRKRKQKKEVKK